MQTRSGELWNALWSFQSGSTRLEGSRNAPFSENSWPKAVNFSPHHSYPPRVRSCLFPDVLSQLGVGPLINATLFPESLVWILGARQNREG